MKLFDGKSGRDYIIADVAGAGETRRRLLDLGFIKGARLTIYNIAPFRTAMLIGLRGYMLAVRKNTGEAISIEEIKCI